MLSSICLEPHSPAKYSIIWLHGLGANGDDFADIVPDLELAHLPIRFIFPHAPTLPITMNGGYIMPAWYDIVALEKANRVVDNLGIAHSIAKIEALIQQEIKQGVLSENIFLVGFSQGGVIALLTGLTGDYKIGGILALSTYLPAWDIWQAKLRPEIEKLPIMVMHGTQDTVVPFSAAQQIIECLGGINQSHQFLSYTMGHSVCAQQLQDISQWVNRQINE